MGFFSQDCRGCGKSIRSPNSITEVSEWMSAVVVIQPNNHLYSGIYDGYGRVDSIGHTFEDAIGFNNEVWHFACWEIEGKPTKYTKASRPSEDQGFFVGDYDPPDPRLILKQDSL